MKNKRPDQPAKPEPASPARRAAGPLPWWRRRWFIRAAIAVAAYTIIGFLILPPIIRWQARVQLSKFTGRAVTIEKVRLNPYALSVTVQNFSIQETNGDRFVGFDELYVNFQLASIFQWAWVFREVRLARPFGQVVYRPDGQFNFADILARIPPDTNAAPTRPPKVLISELGITNGTVAWVDLNRAQPYRAEFTPIDVRLSGFGTHPESENPYSFTAATDSGETFSWSGNFSLVPLRSSGSFKLSQIDLKRYLPYVQDYANVVIVDGRVDVQADYRYDSTTNVLDAELSNGAIEVRNLQIDDAGTAERIVAVPTFSMQQIASGVLRRATRVGLVKTSQGSLLVRTLPDGQLNLLALLKLPKGIVHTETNLAGVVAPTNAAPLPLWDVSVDEIVIDQYTVQAESRITATPAVIQLDQITARLKDVTSRSNAPVALAASMRIAGNGLATAEGSVTALPPAAELRVTVTNLDLRPFQPFVGEAAQVTVTSGALFVDGRARFGGFGGPPPLLSFRGDVAVTNFASIDQLLFKNLARWEALEAAGIELDVQPHRAAAREVRLRGAEAGLSIAPDKRTSIQTALEPPKRTRKAKTIFEQAFEAIASLRLTNVFEASLDRFEFERVAFQFLDQSVQPNCQFRVEQFGGTLTNLSTRAGAIAGLDVRGRVDDRAPFAVGGTLAPLGTNPFADITVTMQNTDLSAFTPYSEKFAGHPLNKGKLNVDLQYALSHHELKAKNRVVVNQLTLGPRNTSPDATKLPVKLAVALLKDREGKIQLDVPISGRLDDPKFKLGGVILQVFVNVLVKAATSPFSLLGAMFGAGEELSFVEFPPGQFTLAPDESKKLDTLAKALFDRPALSLEITGAAEPASDREALAWLKLDQQLKTLFVKELVEDGKPAIELSSVLLEPKDHERLVRKSYKQTLGKYRPSEPKPAVGATNSAATTAPPQTGAALRPPTAEKGATMLLNLNDAATATSGATTTNSAAPAAPARGRAQTELDDMKEQLIERIEVTEEDLRALMQARAQQVQAYLLKGGQIEAGRLFLLAPKPLAPGAKGERRVNLSLN